MNERSAVYQFLARKTGLDPALTLEIDVGLPGGRKVGAVRVGERLDVPGYGAVHFVVDKTSWPVVTVPEGLEHTGTRSVPLFDPKLSAAPVSATEYWERTAMIAAQVAVFDGRFQWAGGRENGWLPIVETVVDTIVAVLGPRDVVTMTCQRTFGMLGVWIRAECRDLDVGKYVADLGAWAEATASGRCMVSGKSGWRGRLNDEDPWEYTLSDRVRELPDPLTPERVYPCPSGRRS